MGEWIIGTIIRDYIGTTIGMPSLRSTRESSMALVAPASGWRMSFPRICFRTTV